MKNWKQIISIVAPIIVPVLGGIVAFFVMRNILKSPIKIPRPEFLFNTLITTATTISGFILSSIAILVGAPNSGAIKKIRESGLQYELKTICVSPLIFGILIIILFTFLGSTVGEDNQLSIVLTSISGASLTCYLISFIYSFSYLISIISLVNKPVHKIKNNPSKPDGNFRGN